LLDERLYGNALTIDMTVLYEDLWRGVVLVDGVSPENAREYLAAGAVAAGNVGNLVSNQPVAAGTFEQIIARAQA